VSVAECFCNAGWSLEDNACAVCAAGSYKFGHGPSECTPCEAGKFSDLVRSTACYNCGPGSYTNADLTRCLLCPADTTSLAAALSVNDCVCIAGLSGTVGLCEACPAGSYKPEPGTAACSDCAPGKVSDAVRAAQDPCRKCTSNSYASAACTQCLPCPLASQGCIQEVPQLRTSITHNNFL